jgi:hypothetical protein
MDLAALGEQLAARKAELMGDAASRQRSTRRGDANATQLGR